MEAIRADGWRSYSRIAKDRKLQHFKVILRDPKAAGRLLPWVYHFISKVKAVIRGTHRGVSEKHLQSYLSEVSYRINCRFLAKKLLDCLVQACISTETLTYKELVRKKDPLSTI